MQRLKSIYFLFLFLLFFAVRAAGSDIEFSFDIPYIPEAPDIGSVTNSTFLAGSGGVVVYANIEGAVQNEVCCKGTCQHQCEPDCSWDNCELMDFYGAVDPRIVPNPICIPNTNDSSDGDAPATCGGKSGNPKIFYYVNGDPSSGGSVDMEYQSITGNFRAEIPTSGVVVGDTLSYYIAAADSRGNVVSQVPDSNIAPCTSITTWDGDYDTPPMNNCAVASSYAKCNSSVIGGTPSCGSAHTMNDPAGDTCDENGDPVTGTNVVDIIGITAGAGKGYQNLPSDVVVCSKIELGDTPPNVGSSSGPIDAYLILFFNPDIVDPNPLDVHMVNAFAVTYSPEVSGADPNLVKVLWDGDCVTNPNTADPLACKLIVGGSEVDELKIASFDGELRIIVKNALPNGDSILGGSSNATKMALATGNIQLDGGTPFWMTDLTAGFRLVREYQASASPPFPPPPAPPILTGTATCVSPSGSWTDGECEKGDTMPAYNLCEFTVYKSPDCGFVDEYRIYHSTTNDRETSELIETITSPNDCLNKNFSHNITSLNGYTHYYWASSVNTQSAEEEETNMSNWASSRCTVEDWVQPSPPTNFQCATPAGDEGVCECSWRLDYSSDWSLRYSKLYRGDDLIVTGPPIPVGVTLWDSSWIDTDPSLVLGSSYTYNVTAIDAGENESDSTSTSCTPEDLKSPSKVDSLQITLLQGQLAVDVKWNPLEEDDVAGYNVYKCENIVPGVSCVSSDQFTKINPGQIPQTASSTLVISDSNFPQGDLEWCFWVEACDDCVAEGTCPSQTSPNCSSFDTMKSYMKCLMITEVIDTYAPLYPDNQTATALAEGEKCKVEWDRVCADDEPFTFPDCDFPDADRLMGYYIMRAESTTGDCEDVTVDTNPVLDSLGHLITSQSVLSGSTQSYLDTGLENGTTYCYRVHAYDAANNFSREDPPPDPAPCTPMDTAPPADPEITDASSTEFSCSVAWAGVQDQSPVVYNVYRCDDSPSNCPAGNFNLITSDTTNTDNTDSSVTAGDEYSYCVTAKDSYDNESSVISGASVDESANCARCVPGACISPADSLQLSMDGTDANVWWTDSECADGTYNVYTCFSNTTTDPVSDCTLVEGNVAGTRTEGAPYVVSFTESFNGYIAVTYEDGGGYESYPVFSDYVNLIIETQYCGNGICDGIEDAMTCPEDCPCGDGTCGSGETKATCSADCECVDYSDQISCEADTSCAYDGEACGEYAPTCVGVCCPPNDSGSVCTIGIIIEGAFEQLSIESCTSEDTDCKTGSYKKVYEPLQGVNVRLVGPGSDDTVVSSVMSDANGEIDSWRIAYTSVSENSTYRVEAVLQDGQYDPPFVSRCSNSSTVGTDGFCVLKLREFVMSEGDTTITGFTPLPAPDGDAMGGPMGDPSGDGTVNIYDLSVMKGAYGTVPGNTCYKAWADLNLDGSVNLFDLAVIKNNYGDQYDTSGGYDPTLSKSNDDFSGASTCCNTGTCE